MMNLPEPDAKPKWDRWVIFIIVAIPLGILLFVLSTVVLTQQREAHEKMIAAQTAQSVAAARIALEKANHDHAFLYAICRALNRRDKVSARTTERLHALELKYHPPEKLTGKDRAYYLDRESILAEAVTARTYIATFDCLKGMALAVKEAPTEPPMVAASTSP